LPFAAVTLLVHLPVILWGVFAPASADPRLQETLNRGFAVTFVQAVLNLVATGAITYGVVEALRGRPVRLTSCLAVGLLRLGPLFLVAFLSIVAIMGGLLLLVVPGIIFACMLWVAEPAAVVERLGIFGALQRSYQLTDGNRWSILGVLILLALIGVAASVTVTLVLPQSLGSARAVVQQILGSLSQSLSAVACAVGYHDLRSVKEGVSAEVLGSVFD
jgi:hypothetical protein